MVIMTIKTEHHKITMKIENIVATIRLAERIDLDLLSKNFSDIQTKRGFPGLLVRLKKPKATVLIFKSGKLVLTGVKQKSNLPIIIDKITSQLSSVGIPLYEKFDYKIQNIVIKGDYRKELNLDLIALHLDRAVYEPEIFPGVIYRVQSPKMSFLFFTSGKFIVTGVKSESDIVPTVKKVSRKIKEIGAFKVGKISNNEIQDKYLELSS